MASVIRAIQTRRTETPRTALAFFGSVIFGCPSAGVGATLALRSTPSLHFIIPIVWIVVAVIDVATIGFVMVAMWVDPKKLQLTPVGAREYLALEQLTLGQSINGQSTIENVKAIELVEDVTPQSKTDSGESQPHEDETPS